MSPTPLPELAATAAPLTPGEVSLPPTAPGEPGAAPSDTPDVTPPTASETSTPATPRPAEPAATGPGSEPTAPPAEASSEGPPRVLADASDRAGDAGVEGPRWADLTRLAVLTAGDDLIVVVELADTAPEQLDEGEVVGIGVDLFRPGTGESGYQLFVDGGSDGWHAYLQTPEGFVAYPGTFAVGGSRLELQVPWRAVGDPREAEVRAFLDWSGEALVTNLVARDDLPDRGRISVVR